MIEFAKAETAAHQIQDSPTGGLSLSLSGSHYKWHNVSERLAPNIYRIKAKIVERTPLMTQVPEGQKYQKG